MSRESEKALRNLMDYVSQNVSDDPDDSEVERLVREYMDQQQSFLDEDEASAPSADDYLELAEKAGTDKKKLEYLKTALKLEPDNLDAARMLARVQNKSKSEYLDALSALIEKADKALEEEGYFRESMGEFWLILETRPYMRLRNEHMRVLIECGKMRAAAAECRRMLELCENDNLGVRYDLIHIYAYLEEEEAAKKLVDQCQYSDSSMMVLPMALLLSL